MEMDIFYMPSSTNQYHETKDDALFILSHYDLIFNEVFVLVICLYNLLTMGSNFMEFGVFLLMLHIIKFVI